MRKIPKTLLLLLATCYWLLAVSGVFAQDQSVLKFRSGAGPGPVPECGPENSTINQGLRGDFGVVMKPGIIPHPREGAIPDETPDCETKREFYKALAIPGKFSRFMELLEPSNTFNIYCYLSGSGSAGFVPDSNNMYYRNCFRIKEDFKPYAFLVLHEIGHIMKHRNYRELYQNFQRVRLMREDPNCFEEGVIKTYNRRGLDDYERTSESSAEAIALYIHNSKDGDYASINDFKNECPSVYKWAKDNVYGEI